MATVARVAPAADLLVVQNWDDCLVALQQGQADAVSTDDSILAGMAVQDPNLHIVGPSLEAEPYGIGSQQVSGRSGTRGKWQPGTDPTRRDVAVAVPEVAHRARPGAESTRTEVSGLTWLGLGEVDFHELAVEAAAHRDRIDRGHRAERLQRHADVALFGRDYPDRWLLVRPAPSRASSWPAGTPAAAPTAAELAGPRRRRAEVVVPDQARTAGDQQEADEPLPRPETPTRCRLGMGEVRLRVACRGH